jgi:hypothetical protein
VNINRFKGCIRLAASALVFSAFFASSAFAAETGALAVTVTDASGGPVAGATVYAKTSTSLTTKTGTTGADGEVRLLGLDPSDEYVLEIRAEGYQSHRNEDVLVVSNRTFSLSYSLQPGGDAVEEIVTYGRSGVGVLVDTTSALQSVDVTLDIMDSLPTGRNYQAYLQMAPSTKPTLDGNPSSKSGVNYSDAVDANGNSYGTSTDNVYYIDGVNITDVQTGTFGGNFNSEIIQEQQIITGGVPAEYEGGQGLVSRVSTKTGSNEFHGSINYYAQNDSLVADNEHLADSTFSTFDTALTLGGPIVKDHLWFFASYQKKEREQDVIDPNTQEFLRTVTTSEDLGFAKLTWQPTENDKITALFFNDPYDRNGSADISVLANRDRGRLQGGDNYKLEYSHAWENVIITGNFVAHEGELSQVSLDSSTRNDVAFSDASVTNVQTDLGGGGLDSLDFRNKESINLTLEWFLDTSRGSHAIKAGYSDVTNDRLLNAVTPGGENAIYTSLGTPDRGTTMNDYVDNVWTGEVDITDQDLAGIINAMAARPDSDYFVGLLDTSGNGLISDAELRALEFNSSAGNPHDSVNVYKIERTQQGATDFATEGNVLYLQDTWTMNDHWVLDLGLRAEEWEHINTAGESIFTFDYEIAPRVSLIYDMKGDGSSKIWGFYGRYYDPIRTDMTAFSGTVTGSIREEQAFVGDRWVTFRTRGGPGDPDGYFAPTTKTPYTDEIMLGYERALTADQTVAITYTKRETGDIMEDYGLCVYTLNCDDPAFPDGFEDPAYAAGGYGLPLSYYGFTEETRPPANFIIATLAGGVRDYEGVELRWRKRRSADSRWFGLASWVYNNAEGNTNSDGNADFQGDAVFLDPRGPNAYGDQPGNTEHLVKLAGSYRWDNGIELGATYSWNSGTLYSETWAASGRHLPVRVDTAYEDQGTTQRWLAPGAIGGQTTESYGILNVRAKYILEFGRSYSAEFFLDVFNVLDDQAARRNQDLQAGADGFAFTEANSWVLPRRVYLGARMSF